MPKENNKLKMKLGSLKSSAFQFQSKEILFKGQRQISMAFLICFLYSLIAKARHCYHVLLFLSQTVKGEKPVNSITFDFIAFSMKHLFFYRHQGHLSKSKMICLRGVFSYLVLVFKFQMFFSLWSESNQVPLVIRVKWS